MNKGNLVRSDFIKNILTLISGTTIAQFIAIAISPILSRIYTPAEFGIFGTYASIIGLVCLFAGARYEGAILLPKENKEAANLLVLSLFFNLIISLLIGILVFLMILFSESFSTQSELIKWFYITPVFVFFIGISQSINSWNNRTKRYRKIVHYRITNSAVTNLSSLALGYVKIPMINGLLASYLVANIVSILVFFRLIKSDISEYKSEITISRMIEVAKKYKRFPFVNSFQALSDTMQINGIIYFVSYFFDKVIVGVYSFAMRILLVPMNFAGAAVAQVFYQHASETYNNQGDLKSLIRNTILKSLLIVIPVLIVLLFFGPQLFAFIFGERWYDAGVYARILAPWILIDFIRAPLSQIPIIVGKQNKLLYFSVISNLIVFVTMLYAGLVIHDIKTGFVILSIFQSLYNIFIIIWFVRIANVRKY